MPEITEEQIAERLGELEPAWAGKPNLFDREIAAKDAKSLVPKLDDANPAVRADAAEALGLLAEHSVTGKLKAMLGDKDAMVRRAAGVALVSLGDAAMADEFIKNLRGASDKVIAGAAMALGMAGYKKAVPYLLKAYRTENPRVAAAIANALGQLADKQAVPWLVQAMKTGLAPAEAASALGNLDDKSATRPLCDALTHELPALRAAAARSLGQLTRSGAFDFVLRDQAVASLHRLTQDADERVRFCAAVALAEFGDEVGKKQVQQFLSTP